MPHPTKRHVVAAAVGACLGLALAVLWLADPLALALEGIAAALRDAATAARA